MKNITRLISNIERVCKASFDITKLQVNRNLTVRNWLIGAYIVEYEQRGKVKADFGTRLLAELSKRLRKKQLKGMDERALRSFRQFYLCYPQFRGTLSPELLRSANTRITIRATVSPELRTSSRTAKNQIANELLLSKLSYSHFLGLISVADRTARAYYEKQSIVNNWSVRELQRAIETLLFQRTRLSRRKNKVVQKLKVSSGKTSEPVFRSPYILDFLGLEQKPEFTESDLEQSIIDHLRKFLMEMGRGFCFEARQKRITFDNQHYFIDLVFYHRILKCHVLVDLKIGAFDHADAGQMNLYLNYYNEEERNPGDNPPIGIVLCAQKNDTLVKYATHGLSQKVFVGKYLVQLPSETELKSLITHETFALLRKKQKKNN